MQFNNWRFTLAIVKERSKVNVHRGRVVNAQLKPDMHRIRTINKRTYHRQL